MAMNGEYFKLVHQYVLNQGMDEIDATDIATSLSVFIPMRYQLPDDQPKINYLDNSHVVSSITKLHRGAPYKRIIPLGLGIRVVQVDHYSDLPHTTTYGQLYYVRHSKTWLETKPNGTTEAIPPMTLLQITEPLETDPELFKQLQASFAEKGLRIEVSNKGVDHPDNVIGLAKIKQMFAGDGSKLLQDEAELQRAEDQSSWSKPAGKIKFRNRPANNITRMRNNKRRG